MVKSVILEPIMNVKVVSPKKILLHKVVLFC